MTDRDEFAKAAMQGMISNPAETQGITQDLLRRGIDPKPEIISGTVSKSSYLMADAMIEARGPLIKQPHDVTPAMISAVFRRMGIENVNIDHDLMPLLIWAILSRPWEGKA